MSSEQRADQGTEDTSLATPAMELKVWVEGIQRIVCGVTDKTTCQVSRVNVITSGTSGA